ncbi:hypothetical protein [Burkholderia multivorans]|uniref:hypothetical protein n=1 Tax=Burkholderia multivorans TaxID=87883 RepID=UPI0021BE5AF0|nr:hypothetical protein [Burkholderia multivorans]
MNSHYLVSFRTDQVDRGERNGVSAREPERFKAMRERSTNFMLQTVWHRADAIADGNREQPLKIENGTLLKPTHECRRFAAQDDATCGKLAFARVWRAVISIGIGGWIVPMRVQLRRDRGGRWAARQMGRNI